MSRGKFVARLLDCAPQLLKNQAFKARLAGSLSEDELQNLTQGRINPDEPPEDGLYDGLYDAYMDCAERVLSLGWDGGAPGMSGALWVDEVEGIYVITSSDFDEMGPFVSLEEVLQQECFGPTPKAELSSETLPEEKLLEIGSQVIWDDESAITINHERYQMIEDRLIPVKTSS